MGDILSITWAANSKLPSLLNSKNNPFGRITTFSSSAEVIPEVIRLLNYQFGGNYQIHHLSNGVWNWNLTKSSMIEKMQCLLDYTSFTPSFDANDCRAKANIFISKPCTAAVMNDIDESFAIPARVYDYLNFTTAMQIIGGEVKGIKFVDGRKICLMNTGLHRGGKVLYAVIVPNSKSNTRQQWMMTPHEHISEAFMTQDGLKAAYGLCPYDLSKGAMAKDQTWKIQKNQLEWCLAQREQMTQLIRWYFHGRSKIPIIQSQKKAQNYQNGNITMTRDEFAHYVLDSLHYALDNDEIINIAHVDIHQYKYQIDCKPCFFSRTDVTELLDIDGHTD